MLRRLLDALMGMPMTLRARKERQEAPEYHLAPGQLDRIATEITRRTRSERIYVATRYLAWAFQAALASAAKPT